MKKIYYVIFALVAFITFSSVNACGTSDRCSNCCVGAAQSSCQQSLASAKSKALNNCKSLKNSQAITECQKGVNSSTTYQAVSGLGNCSKPGGTSGGGSTGGGSTGGGSTGGGSTGGNTGTGTSSTNSSACEACKKMEETGGVPASAIDACYKANNCEVTTSSSQRPQYSMSKTLEFDEPDKLINTDGCEGVFGKLVDGKFTEHNSLGFFLQSIFNIIKYAVPLLLIGLTIYDFVSAMVQQNNDALKKALQTVYKRAIIAVLIFIIPTLLTYLLEFITEHGTCGIR